MTRIAIPFRCPKIVLWVTLFLGLMLGVHLVLPYVVDTERVRRMVIARASEAYSGEVEFAKFEPALLPWPHVRITQGRLSDGDRITLKIHEAAVYMKLWPLLAGKLRIDRIKLIRSSWMVDMGQFDAAATVENRSHPAISVLAPFIRFLGNAAAESVDGRFVLHRNGRSVVQISEVSTHIASSEGQVRLKMRGSTNLSGDFIIAADLDLKNLNGRGSLSITGLRSKDLPALGLSRPIESFLQASLDLDVNFHIFGMERFQARFKARTSQIRVGKVGHRMTIEDMAISGRAGWTPRRCDIALSGFQTASPAMNWSGSFSWDKDRSIARAPIRIILKGANLEISPIRDRLLKLFTGQPVLARVLDIVREGKVSIVTLGVSASDWQALKEMKHLQAEAYLTGGRIVVPNDLFDLEQVSGRVVIADGRLIATGISAQQGNAIASHGELTIGLYDGSRAFSLDTLIDTDVAELPLMLRRLVRSEEARSHLDRLPAITGRVSGRLKVGDHLDRLSTEITAKARIATADTSLDLVGDFKDFPGNSPSTNFSISGRMGSAVLDWLVRFGKVPPVVAPKAPLTVSGLDIALTPPGRVRLSGMCEWDDGASVGATLTYSEDDVYLQWLHIRDPASEALISFRKRSAGRLLDLGFSGHLEASTIGRFVDDHRLRSGAVQGRFRVQIDRKKPGATTLEGELFARDLGYQHEDVGDIHIIEASIGGQGRQFEIPKAILTWDKSTITLVADGHITPQAVDLRGKVQADTFQTQKAVAVFGSGWSESSQDETRTTGLALPVIGTLKVEADQLIVDRFRLSSVNATIEIKDRETIIDVAEADLCAIQMPGRIRVSDGLIRLAFAPHAEASSLKSAGSCAVDSQGSEKLLGTLNLKGRFTTQGKNRDALFANLKGAGDFAVDKGRITNVGSAGVFTSLLSYLSIHQYVQGDLPDLRENDFVYNRIASRWAFENGALRIEEGVLKSNSVNMVADGHYDLLSDELDMVVLVSPLTTMDWIIDRIPIVGNILQGTLVAIPVRVKGPKADPKVVPLSPTAVGKRLGGILERTLKTPVRIIEPLLKDGDGQGQTNDDK